MSHYVDHGYRHLPGGTDPIGIAMYEIKVFSDTQTVTAGDTKFAFPIPTQLDGWSLALASAGISTESSSGDVEVMISNRGDDMLGTNDMLAAPIVIAAGDLCSPDQTSLGINEVVACDWISIDVDAAGTGAKGLAVVLEFTR